MRVTIQLLAWELDLTIGPATDEPDDDKARDLSGGTTASTAVEPGPTDLTLGFTNGLEDRT